MAEWSTHKKPMVLNNPIEFELVLSGGVYQLLRDSSPVKFTKPLSTRGVAKLYTVSIAGSLAYVGISQQPMSSRLRYGFRADGANGYHGYKWKGHEGVVRLSVWTATVGGDYVSLRELETVEAEVAFLCRLNGGQWPAHQHEIHFFASEQRHRDAALKIYDDAVQARG